MAELEIQLVDRDYDAYIAQLETAANAEFPSWTDFNKSNIGYVYLELLAAQGDQSSYYLNSFINETFLPTVKRRENAIKILEGRMNYQLGGPTPALVDLTFTIPATLANDVLIPEGYTVESIDGLTTFETTVSVQIDAGLTSVIVSCKNWVSQTDANISFDDSQNQEVTLANENYINKTAEINISAVDWLRVDDFTESGPTDKHFKVSVNNELQAILIFSDGVRGEKPVGNGDATYKTGGGIGANGVQPNELTSLTDPILDTLNNEVEITVTNVSSPSGGEDAETLDQARVDAPKSKRSTERTVTVPDYEANAELVDGIARVLALGKQEDITIQLGTTLSIATPVGGGVLSAGLIAAIELMYSTTRPVGSGSEFVVTGATYSTITPVGTVIAKTGFTLAAVKTAVDQALLDYFNYESLDDKNEPNINYGFKKPIFFVSTLVDIIMNVKVNSLKAVDNVTLTSPVANINIADKVIPELGVLTGLVVT